MNWSKCRNLIVLMLTMKNVVLAQVLDPTFGDGGLVQTHYGQYVDSKVHDLLLMPDGRFVVCGTTFVNTYDFMMIRYMPDGTLDPSFGDNGKAFVDFDGINNYGIGYCLQQDGKIVATGYSETPGYTSMSLARFNADGSKDESFGSNGIINIFAGMYESYGHDVLMQPDGKIVAAGEANYGTQGIDLYLVRYNNDGTPDVTFGENGVVENVNDLSSVDNPVLTLQEDGKILACGMGAAASIQHYCVMRFLESGALDNTFSDDGIQLTFVSGDYNWPGNIIVQPDGKILSAGYSGPWQSEHFSMVRWDTNGNLDPNFASNGVFIHSINPGLDLFEDVILQPDGKILACGYTIVTNQGYDFVVMRLNANGTIETDFGFYGVLNQQFSYLESRAAAMAIQQDGKLLVAGDCPDFLNHHTAVARYDVGIPASVYSSQPQIEIRCYPNPVATHLSIEFSEPRSINKVSIIDVSGKLFYSEVCNKRKLSLDMQSFPKGAYLIECLDDRGHLFEEIIIHE